MKESEQQALLAEYFFTQPALLRAMGDNDDYLVWLHKQPCASCGLAAQAANIVQTCSVSQAAAVRLLYTAIPLCYCCYKYGHTDAPLDWYKQQRLSHRTRWVQESLLQQLGYADWATLPSALFYDWIKAQQLTEQLPRLCRESMAHGR